MIKVSIIVPVYNSSNYIKRCIESILNQTYKNFELILINDGSTDDSLKIIKEFEKKDDRIRVFSQKNQGVAKTRNKGIQLAKGEFITFIDNDDYIENDYLEKYIKYSNDYDVIVGGYKRVTDDKVLFIKDINKTNWSKYENVAPWGKLIRRDYLIDNNVKFFPNSIGEDIPFNFDLYSLSNKIKVTNISDYCWFFNGDSVSNTKQKKFDKDILKLFNELKKHDYNDETKYFIARYMVWYLLFSGSAVHYKEFILEFRKIKNWLEKNDYIQYLKINNVINNEATIKNKLIIIFFIILVKLNLIGLFSKVYCRGR